MNNTMRIDAKTVDQILKRLEELTRDVKALREKLIDEEPEYGSDAWWDWSNKKALEDIKNGRSTTIRNKKELKVFLDSLK